LLSILLVAAWVVGMLGLMGLAVYAYMVLVEPERRAASRGRVLNRL